MVAFAIIKYTYRLAGKKTKVAGWGIHADTMRFQQLRWILVKAIGQSSSN